MSLRSKPYLLLLCVLLASCASAPPAHEAGNEAPWACGDSAASSVPSSEELAAGETFQPCESSSEDACFSLTCNQEACALFRQVDTEAGRVVPTRGVGPILPPTTTAQRYWAGILIPFPLDRPVFIIPWNHHKPLLPSQRKMLDEALRLAQEPHEKHHIFPQEPGLKEWFEFQHVNIHQETMLLDLPTHRRIHSGPKGGPWNEAWREFKRARPTATNKEMHEHAWELIKRFKLVGFILPYYDKPPYLLPPPIEY